MQSFCNLIRQSDPDETGLGLMQASNPTDEFRQERVALEFSRNHSGRATELSQSTLLKITD
jgi:hypothetical protein